MRRAGTVLAAMAAVGLLGCSGPVADDGAALPPLPPGADEPFDLFRNDDLTAVERATGALYLDCLAREGYPQERALAQGTEPAFAVLDEPPLRPTTVAEARQDGLGSPLPAQPAKIVRTDPVFHAAAESCVDAAADQLGGAAEVTEVRDRYSRLGNTFVKARGEAVQQLVREHADAFAACLAEQGFRLPDGASFDPSADADQFGVPIGTNEPPRPADPPTLRGLPAGVEVVPGTRAQDYLPTAREREYAVALVTCLRDTGLLELIEERLPELEQRIVEEHAAELADLNPRLQALADRARTALGTRSGN